MKQVKN